MHSLICYYNHLLRYSTIIISKPNPPTPPHWTNPSRYRKIRSIWPPPVTPSSHRRSNPSLRPTPLKHHSSSWHLSTNSYPPYTPQQPYRLNSMSLHRCFIHIICCYMCSNPKRHQKNYCFLYIKPTGLNNSYNRTKLASISIPTHFNPRLLQSNVIPLLRLYHP